MSSNNNQLRVNICLLLSLLTLLNLILLHKIDFNFQPIVLYEDHMSEPSYWRPEVSYYKPLAQHNKKNNDDDDHDEDTTPSPALQYEIAPWNKCTLLKLLGEVTIGLIRIEYDKVNGRMVVSNPNKVYKREEGAPAMNSYILPIAHPATCPFSMLMKSNSIVHQRLQQNIPSHIQFKVGVAIIIEDVHNRIFLTKRASLMRLFPDEWVVPGGHIEKGESFVDTARRELEEETGLKLDVEISMFGAFESTYPVNLEKDKLPSEHHIVLYTKAKLLQEIDSQSLVKLSDKEVAAAAWVPISELAEVLSGRNRKEFEFTGHLHDYQSLVGLASEPNSKPLEAYYHATSPPLDHTKLKQEFTNGNERISTGTVYILKQYLHELANKKH
ncbi:hypothetical protein SAMD00019534_039260, partial [Acytostelium subglobosum LB1]|uniref:hypothetical protein n=1 Tax=Acytostelium subglobosum LB1 TaxID=1410327 RepID=UPI000644FDF8